MLALFALQIGTHTVCNKNRSCSSPVLLFSSKSAVCCVFCPEYGTNYCVTFQLYFLLSGLLSTGVARADKFDLWKILSGSDEDKDSPSAFWQ